VVSSVRTGTLGEEAGKLTYCQSKDTVKSPIPSLLVAPPNTFVSVAALSPVALIAAKQGMETEFSQGKMYAGKNS
jgi:hypothetical protein